MLSEAALTYNCSDGYPDDTERWREQAGQLLAQASAAASLGAAFDLRGMVGEWMLPAALAMPFKATLCNKATTG
jgi:hypothetical protein